jgi:hypothetical protein
MSRFTYIRNITIQKVVIESQYKHPISDKITKLAKPGETYIKKGFFRDKVVTAKEELYSVTRWFDEDEVMSRQQIIDTFGVDPENLESDLEYTATIYYTNDYIIKTADDMKSIMDWVNNKCPDFKDLIEIKEVL